VSSLHPHWRHDATARWLAPAILDIETPAEEGLWGGRSQLQEVRERLFISNFFGARSLQRLAQAGITHVLVCAGELPTPHTEQVAYRRLSGLYDAASCSLAEPLLGALPWMQEVLASGGRLLLHCAAGVSRSATILVAYLMWSERKTYEEALDALREARPVVDPHPAFAAQLREGACFRPLPPPTP
jgi:hypothetical protein